MITFYYGTMNAGKTLHALVKAFNLKERGFKVKLLKPTLDTRTNTMWSRVGLEEKCESFEDFLINDSSSLDIDAIIVDEIQFATKEQIDLLVEICDMLYIDLYCYGLKTDSNTNLFEGSKRLFEIANSIQEILSICHCGEPATHNLLVDKNSKPVYNIQSNINIENKNNIYYSVYTSQIEKALEENGAYILKEGDMITISASNSNTTISQSLKNFFYSLAGNNNYSIVASQTGIVAVNGS